MQESRQELCSPVEYGLTRMLDLAVYSQGIQDCGRCGGLSRDTDSFSKKLIDIGFGVGFIEY